MIEFRNVSKTYDTGTEAVHKANFNIEKGEFAFLVGTSGSGKSTLLSLLAGLDEPKSGAVLYNNEDIKIKGYEKHRKNNISLIFQNYNLIDYMTPLENLKIVNPKADKSILNDLGLKDDEINRNVLQLSGGQQQRVSIGRALMNAPSLVLADEPTGNLDPEISWEIMQVLERINLQGTTIIMATHNSTIVNNLRHRVVAIEEGRIVRDEEEGEYGYHD